MLGKAASKPSPYLDSINVYIRHRAPTIALKTDRPQIKKENLDVLNTIQSIELKRNHRTYNFNDILADALNLLCKERKYVLAVSEETLSNFEQLKQVYNRK